MQHIGQRIKELRRKYDITQEKLADYLCVSYQAVSKWETGVSSPDLSLIGPLTKLLHVTADELLGLNEAQEDKRRLELEEAYENSWKSGDLDERISIAKTAVAEYPGDMKYLGWLAMAVSMHAHTLEDNNDYRAELEKAIKLYETVIEGAAEGKVKNEAIYGIVIALSLLNRKDEALKYAQAYPEAEELDKDEVIKWCLDGEAKLKHQQESIKSSFEKLLRKLMNVSKLEYFRVMDELIKVMIPDQNYLGFNDFLYFSSLMQAEYLTKEGKYDEAMSYINKTYEYAKEFDRIVYEDAGKHKFTAPTMNLVYEDTKKVIRTGTTTKSEELKEQLGEVIFAPLRDRADFCELVKAI